MATDLMQPGGGLTNSKLRLATATIADVLSGKKFYSGDKELKTGTMANRGAWSSSVAPGNSVTIPAGYHNGGGKVTANNPTYHSKDYTYYPWQWSGNSTFDVRKIFGIPNAVAGRLSTGNFFGKILKGQQTIDHLPTNADLIFVCNLTYDASSRNLHVNYSGTGYNEFTVTEIVLHAVWAT